MASLLPRARGLFPGLADWIENPWPFGEHNLVRIEERAEDGKYIVRAELPGFDDPERQIHITTSGGVLTVSAERESRRAEGGRSEFRYGAFSRSVTLPDGADTANITAKYTNGILEITVPVERLPAEKPIEVKIAKD